MTKILSKTLFFVTSPRTPAKMRPEIQLLTEHFAGMPWNKENQQAYMKCLAEQDFFQGQRGSTDPAFSARDRINRAPKALGFIDLTPKIALTDAGSDFLQLEWSDEALLRQLLKFQLPSPFHQMATQNPVTFWVKPYLEIFRLIRELDSLTFDELRIFGMQLTNYRDFDVIVQKIRNFREKKLHRKENYKTFVGEIASQELQTIYREEIAGENFRTRESLTKTCQEFIKKKNSNLRDYTDACIRYLRATGLVSISQNGHSLSILPERLVEVDYFLNSVPRDPCHINDENAYKQYLFANNSPKLYTDNRRELVSRLLDYKAIDASKAKSLGIRELKLLLKQTVARRRSARLQEQVHSIKLRQKDKEILDAFQDILRGNYYDLPLMLEWNTWRAMTILDHGNITANLNFDDAGDPMSTAPGNMADIICDYGSFALTVEVTTQVGQRQYEMEGEPVSRHLANLKKQSGKEAYCFFIAPRINEASLAHFFMLYRTNISYYGGYSVIIPLTIDVFSEMVRQSCLASPCPGPMEIRNFCEFSRHTALHSASETEWFQQLTAKALHWL